MLARSLICAATVAVLTPAVSWAAIIVPTYVSGTNVNSDTGLGFDPANTTTNGGLSVALDNGDSLAMAQGATFSQTNNSQLWETNTGGANYFDGNSAPSLVFDLGGNKTLANLILWEGFSGNDNQTSSFEVNYSNDGVTFGAASSFVLTEIVPDGVPVPSQSFLLGGTHARFVQLTLLSNHYGEIGVGGDRVGFGKILFDGIATVPEASTWLMMIAGFGLGGMVLRRRNSILA